MSDQQTSRADAMADQIITAALECVRFYAAPDRQREALRNRLSAILAAPSPADERAALPQIPDLVKAMAWLTVCLRTELSRLDDTTHKALDEVEAQLCCVRAITNGAIDYEAMVATHPGRPGPRAEVPEEQPSLTNPLTPYGMLVRALRIVSGATLMDMATALLTTPAKLSSMEFGRVPVTHEFASDVAAYFDSLSIPGMYSALVVAIDTARAGGNA
ncbi:hypothetical protein [Burkholderia metallica]|uniref:hypothetical protein n=1 Tax=Burkholderia metallica TaxID=488729 RepID=UPI001CF4D879|nr:hypothetical protein [Burkholderia metallica]MCA8017756.1 hypothetical protein [Burkholderia metallica]